MLPGPPQKLSNLVQEDDLGAIMAHLGRSLLPTWPILRPSWAHLRPNFAKNLHQIFKKRPQTSQDDPGSRQRAPGQPLEPQFQWFRDRFWTLFVNLFQRIQCNLRPHFESNFKAAGLARWRLCARSALDIRRPPEGCRACVNLGVQLVQYQISNPT